MTLQRPTHSRPRKARSVPPLKVSRQFDLRTLNLPVAMKRVMSAACSADSQQAHDWSRAQGRQARTAPTAQPRVLRVRPAPPRNEPNSQHAEVLRFLQATPRTAPTGSQYQHPQIEQDSRRLEMQLQVARQEISRLSNVNQDLKTRLEMQLRKSEQQLQLMSNMMRTKCQTANTDKKWVGELAGSTGSRWMVNVGWTTVVMAIAILVRASRKSLPRLICVLRIALLLKHAM